MKIEDARPGQCVAYLVRRPTGPAIKYGGHVVRINRVRITVRLHIGDGKYISRAIKPEHLFRRSV